MLYYANKKEIINNNNNNNNNNITYLLNTGDGQLTEIHSCL